MLKSTGKSELHLKHFRGLADKYLWNGSRERPSWRDAGIEAWFPDSAVPTLVVWPRERTGQEEAADFFIELVFTQFNQSACWVLTTSVCQIHACGVIFPFPSGLGPSLVLPLTIV